MQEQPEPPAAVCSQCRAEKVTKPLGSGEPALPPGWKRLGESIYCSECWASAFATRCISLPVWSVEPNEGEGTDKAWKRFRDALNLSWRQATAYFNWCLREIARNDNEPVETKDGKTKLPALPKVDLYRLGREQWPELDSQSLGSLAQRARAKYRECRWDCRVTFKRSLPTERFPTPLPIPAKDAHLSEEKDQLWVSVRVSCQRFNLRLARGPKFHRQWAAVRQVFAGTARQGELVLRDAGREIMAGIVLNLPTRPAQRENTLIVRTAKDRLWTVLLDGRDHSWNLNEDQIKQILIGHAERRQRLAEDRKFERRLPRNERGNFDRVGERMSERYANRTNDYCHKAASMLIGFAQRNRVAAIQYHEVKEEKFFEAFPWFKLRTMVEQKAAAVGITVEVIEASEEKAPE